MSPLRTAFLAQFLGAAMATSAALFFYPKLLSMPVNWAFGQGAGAALVSHKLGGARWWIPIHLTFLPMAMAMNQLAVPSTVWLGGFLLLFLLFWRTDKSRVPLFLTNARTAKTITSLLPAPPCHCIDVGCGTGSLLSRLAQARPDCTFEGIEHAPIPFLIAWLRSRRYDNLTIRHGDFWQADLSQYQVVYAFLSPIPMPRLWEKICSEMTADSLLISNSFIIPGVSAFEEITVSDYRRTHLYCYTSAPYR